MSNKKRGAAFAVAISSLVFAFPMISTAREVGRTGPSCAMSGLSSGSYGFVDGQLVFVRRVAKVLDQAVDDFGESVADDNLEFYCVGKKPSDKYGDIAVCLSGEKCPWRQESSD